MIFFGTQPTLTQVPPQKRSSATPTRAPWPAAMRAQRTPAGAAADDEEVEVVGHGHPAAASGAAKWPPRFLQVPMPPSARYFTSR